MGPGIYFFKEQLLYVNVQRFREGLVFKAHRLLHHSALGSRVIKKKKSVRSPRVRHGAGPGKCARGRARGGTRECSAAARRLPAPVQGYLALKKQPPLLGPYSTKVPRS